MRIRNNRGQVTGEVLLVAVGIALAVYIGTAVVDGAKKLGHKTKCGVMKIVGKNCDPPVVQP